MNHVGRLPPPTERAVEYGRHFITYGASIRPARVWRCRHNASMEIIRRLIIVAALLTVGVATSACPEKGPAEKAGEQIDKAIDKTKDAVKDGK